MMGENRFLVNPEDLTVLAYALNLCIEDKKIAMQLGKKGYKFVNKNYSMDAMVDSYLKYCQELIDTF